MAKKKPVSLVVASTLAIALLFIGAIYFWNRQVRNIDDREKAKSTATLNNANSDLSDLEAELKSVDFSQIN
jgi:hypothetical protein